MIRSPTIIPFVMCGDPDLDSTLGFLMALDKYADVIELGIPFSDPIADGKAIQKASVRALESGTRVEDAFDIVSRFRERSDTPVVLMTYYNLIYRMGPRKFLTKARDAGASGTIIVDLPLEESQEYREICKEVGLKAVFLVAPNTDLERVRSIDDASTGFVYLVAHLGTTGERDIVPKATLNLLKEVKTVCKRPVAVGFGISTPDHVAQLLDSKADAVVVGSALVSIIEKHGRDAIPYLEERMLSFKKAVDKNNREKGRGSQR
ncbi:MAG TPA: tryptophan synthase subunit alpha [Candidatus Methanofastidiosa archaeon]|nr:tryptophan synthase subunit alpha [Candidatus Methanofastidiosa archaeon]